MKEEGERAEPQGLQDVGCEGTKAVHSCLQRNAGAFIPLPSQQLLIVLQDLHLQLCMAGSVWEAAQPPEGPCAN